LTISLLRTTAQVAVNDLTEQNTFLQNLRNSFNLIASRGVQLATISGTGLGTLENIALQDNRSPDDKTLNRWRDGSANPNPPPTDTEQGDETVTLASAQIGTENVLVSGHEHIKLPDAAQDQVLEILGLDAVAEQFDSELPKKNLFGITILSPIEVVVNGSDGKILSKTQNTFGEDVAEYDDDPDDPDDPIDINFADLPDDTYTLNFTGTGTGEYTVIITYADDDETTSSVFEGTTFTGQTFQKTITIGNGTTSIIDDSDYQALLREISKLAQKAKRDDLIKGYERANITRDITHALNDLKKYQRRLTQDREESAYDSLRKYYQHLNNLDNYIKLLTKRSTLSDFTNTIQNHLTNAINNSPLLP